MGRIGCVRCEKIPTWLRATNFCINCTTSPRFAPSFIQLRKDSQCTGTLWNAPKHDLWSNGVDQVLWLRKITTWLRGTNFCINCTCSICFATNPPYPRHLVPNSCFGAFHSVWVHLGRFRYCMKLGAKWAEQVQLMQKFVPRSRVGFFSQQTHPIHLIEPWTHLLLYFLVLGSIWDCFVKAINSVQNWLNWCN